MALLRIAEAADVLGVCERTVFRMLADGQLPRVKVRHATKIPRTAIDALIQAQTIRTTASAAVDPGGLPA